MRSVLCLLLFASSALACATSSVPAPTASAAANDAPAVVIRSPAELEQYLHAHRATPTPLDALSPGARQRFLASLQFGSHGLGGFATADLAEELDAAQIRRVLALFDAADYAEAITPAAKPLRGSDPPSHIDHQYTAFFVATLPRRDTLHDLAQQTRSAYRQNIAPLQTPQIRARADGHDLGLLYRAALRLASRDRDNARALSDARHDLDALAKHDLATAPRVDALHRALVSAREFAKARHLAADFPAAKLEPLPQLRDETGGNTHKPTFLLLKPAEHELVRKSIDLDAGLHIIVIAGCHFSVDAVESVESDPAIAALFHRDALWLASQSESLRDVAAWNREHPQQPMRVAWKNSEWTRITSWAMPTFYIFRDGQLIVQWAGWPGDTGMRTLRQHLEKNRLLKSAKALVPK